MKKLFPLIGFHLLSLIILLVNFPFGKSFIGWDSITPEFNFGLNIKRALFATWQENYGLGTLAGHGFAATLPHSLITFLMSLVLPTEAIRPAFTFLCLYIGGLGMYFLVDLILKRIKLASLDTSALIPFISLFSSAYYLLNLGTVQTFYIQLEAFIVQFAMLPWLFWATIKLLEQPNKRTFFLFIIINLLATVQGFIPPLFIAYMIALGIFLLFYWGNQSFGKTAFKKILMIVGLTMAINAYWLLPLGVYTVSRSSIYLNSYNNVLSTPEFIAKNKKYGDLKNVAQIKGFIFDSVEGFDKSGNVITTFQPWSQHQNNRAIPLIGYSFFALIAIGLIFALMKIKDWLIKAFASIMLFFFTGLTTNFFPFSLITHVLQTYMPIYRQAFRAAFTKFAVGVSFSYSIFLALGLVALIFFILKLKNKVHQSLLLFLMFLLLIIYALPAFKGNLLYSRITQDIPKAYLDVMDYFKDKPMARIADFPQDCPEGWIQTKWGYIGSGFLWYSIPQPLMTRSADVWGNYNENYYWELMQALREENYTKVDALFTKYDIRWILYDPNTSHCRNQKAFFQYQSFLNYLNTSDSYKLVRSFTTKGISPISIYEKTDDQINSFVSLKKNLPNIGPQYAWNDNDKALQLSTDYVTDNNKEFDSYYPFRSLFTKRKASEADFSITNTNDSIILKNTLEKGLAGQELHLPALKDTEKIVPVALEIKTNTDQTKSIYLSYGLPKVYLDNTALFDESFASQIGTIMTSESIQVFINDTLVKKDSLDRFYNGAFGTQVVNTIKIVDSKTNLTLWNWSTETDPMFNSAINTAVSFTIPAYSTGEISVQIPKIIDHSIYGFELSSNLKNYTLKPCNEVVESNNNMHETADGYTRLISQNSRQCLVFNFQSPSTSFGYIVGVTNRHIAGENPLFYISNKKAVQYLQSPLEPSKEFKTSYFVLPPTFEGELGYDIYFDNMSENNDKTINDFGGLGIWEIPYSYLTNMMISPPNHQIVIPPDLSSQISVVHPNPTKYEITINKNVSPDSYLILSQSFDTSWKAYETKNGWESTFPFLLGKELPDHILINNWENGWKIDTQAKNITIIFWPQYLEFIGFGLLAIAFFTILRVEQSKDEDDSQPA